MLVSMFVFLCYECSECSALHRLEFRLCDNV